jgi:hypothetical protein
MTRPAPVIGLYRWTFRLCRPVIGLKSQVIWLYSPIVWLYSQIIWLCRRIIQRPAKISRNGRKRHFLASFVENA